MLLAAKADSREQPFWDSRQLGPLEATESKAEVRVHGSPPPLGAPSGEARSWRAGRWGRGWASTRCRSWKAAARGCRCAARWRGTVGPPWHGNTWKECWKMKRNQGNGWSVRRWAVLPRKLGSFKRSLIDLCNYRGLSQISDPIFQLQRQRPEVEAQVMKDDPGPHTWQEIGPPESSICYSSALLLCPLACYLCSIYALPLGSP